MAVLLRQLFGLLAQLVLIAREAFELPLDFLGAQAGLVPGQLTLLLRQRLLPARQLANAREWVLVFVALFRARFARGRRFVVRLLPLAQLLFKERRQIERLAVTVAPAALRLLHGDLPAANLGLGLQQVTKRGFFKRQRLAGAELVEFGHRLSHGPDRLGHGTFGVGPRQQSGLGATAAPLLRKRCSRHVSGNLFRLVAHAGLRRRDRPDVAFRPRIAGAAGAGVELPRRRHHVLLLGDQLFQAGLLRLAATHGLALRGSELFFVRLHLEEEDIAARLGATTAAADIASTRVVGHEVAGRDMQVFEIQGVRARRHRPADRLTERHHRFLATRGLDYQFQ